MYGMQYGMGYGLWYDLPFMVVAAIGMLLALGTSGLVKLQFARGRRVALASGLSGAEVAQRILADADIRDVTIVEAGGLLSDHYNPLTRTLALSGEVYRGVDAASAGVAAHEVGHAIQHARGYAPMWLRSAIVPLTGIGSWLGPLLVMFGALLAVGAHARFGMHLATAGVGLFAITTLFTLVTVPVEFDASARGRERLVALGIARPGPEADAVRGVLTAAGLTYVAALITSLLQLAYWAWRAGLIGGRSDDR